MADARFKAENGILVKGTSGSANSYIEHNLGLGANLTVSGNLISVAGDLVISGNIVYTATQVQSQDFVPTNPTGINLGNSTYRFDGFFRNLNVSNTIVPTTAGLTLGQPGARWDTYSTNVNANGTLSVVGAAGLSNTLTVTGSGTFTNSVAITGTLAVNSAANVAGALVVGGSINAGANVTSKGIILDNATIFSNTKTVVGTAKTTVDSFANSVSNFSKVILSVKDASANYHAIEILILHTGTNVLLTQYGEIFNTRMGTFDADYNGANVDIYFTASSAGTYTVKSIRQNILA